MSIRFFTASLLGAGLLFLSCSSPSGPDPPFRTLEGLTPIVTGLRITNSSGPTEIATWCQPSDPSSQPSGGKFPTSYGLSNSYPNPSSGTLSVNFSLMQQSTVSLWVVRARPSGTEISDLVDYGGGGVYTPLAVVVKKLVASESLQTGHYGVSWDTRDDNGELVAKGFYRIYFQAGDYSSFRDVLIYRSLEDLPASLRKFAYI